ncbi:MAG: phosphoribosylanthranilate isomerase [Cyclobacteriaceae bacterium]|nr:phosphoribosylanthranilate isomerase [Cyclobacteriaceae bacterium]
MKIKVCGMKDPQNIAEIADLNPDYMGFIFFEKSPRYAETLNPEVMKSINPNIKKAGVFVNMETEQILHTAKKFHLDALQLHGNEKPELCRKLKDHGFEIIKAFQVDDKFDFDTTRSYAGVSDYFLFDTKSTGWGGSGVKFDHEILNRYDFYKPYFISGGIELKDIPVILSGDFPLPATIDINSRFELSPGMKDVALVARAIENVKQYNAQYYES